MLPFLAAVIAASSSLAGTLTGTLTENTATGVDLTAAGPTDWAVWGYATAGTSTSLSPDNRKSGGTAISSLTTINPLSAPLRAIGQFGVVNPYSFNWTNGSPVASASGARTGLQHNGSADNAMGAGFSFTVPAGTTQSTMKIWGVAHLGTGTLTATLSDGSAVPLTLANASESSLRPQLFTLSFAANSPGQTLTVSYTMTSCVPLVCNDGQQNVVLYGVALDTPAPVVVAPASIPTLSEWAMIGLASFLAMFGMARIRRRQG